MKSQKIILAIILIGINLPSLSQKKESGLLILSTWRDHTSFDLFVPGNIDKTKSLRTNLANLSDTAIRFGIYDDKLLKATMLKRAKKLVNESKVKGTDKDVLVLVVEVEYFYEDYTMLLPEEIYDYVIILHGKTIVKVYNNKKPFFRKLKVLKLPTNDAANTSIVK